ncbi:MAG: hypothetical protein ACOYO1_02500 [Bacteroidales bacterium]
MNKIYKKYIIITVIIIAIALIIYFVGRKASSIAQVYLPDENKQITESDTKEIRNITRSLYDDMKGFNFTRNIDAYKKLLGLSNVMFISVYNDFNKMYSAENSGTLRKWIEAEKMYTIWDGFNFDFDALKTAILERMNKLNLT